jgi:hypothetical protein
VFGRLTETYMRILGGGVSTIPVSSSMCELRLTHADRRPRRRNALIRRPHSLSTRPRSRPREPQRRVPQYVPTFSHKIPSLTLPSNVRDVWEELFQSRFRVGFHDRARCVWLYAYRRVTLVLLCRSLKNIAMIMSFTGRGEC